MPHKESPTVHQLADQSWVPDALSALASSLRNDTPPVEFLPAEAGNPPHWVQREDIPTASVHRGAETPAVVVRTSGSTGTPKQTLLSAAALKASAQMTAEHLGGHGQWLLTLQPSYVAGLAILSRSLDAATVPVALLEHTTHPEAFTHAARMLTAPRRYVSLVPTQLTRLLQHTEQNHELLAALRRFDAILLGGGASSPELLQEANSAGLNIIRTYGMSETCGGCVYDGKPLPGVHISIEPLDSIPSSAGTANTTGLGTPDPGPASPGPSGFSLRDLERARPEGRVILSGPQIALGYLDPELTAERFGEDSTGRPYYRTDDMGILSEGTLSITGRIDDVINTGGIKVSAERIRQVIEEDPEVTEAFVTGIPHTEWGQQVAAVVTLANFPAGDFVPLPADDGAGQLAEYPPREWHGNMRASVRHKLGPAAVPKQIRFLRSMPRLANGKVDRQELLKYLQL